MKKRLNRLEMILVGEEEGIKLLTEGCSFSTNVVLKLIQITPTVVIDLIDLDIRGHQICEAFRLCDDNIDKLMFELVLKSKGFITALNSKLKEKDLQPVDLVEGELTFMDDLNSLSKPNLNRMKIILLKELLRRRIPSGLKN